jgi:ribulose-5-phosphate 4-epimerase/fuculose-1-phosphate aldolase
MVSQAVSQLEAAKFQVAAANRMLTELGLAVGIQASQGHASLRVPGSPDQFLVKGRGYEFDALSEMGPGDMITCDLDGNLVDGPPGARQCNEVKMHSCLYKTHPEVQSVVHVHPRYVVAMSVLQRRLVPMCQEGIALVRDPLPVYPHVKGVWTEEEGLEVARMLGSGKAILLYGHGATTAGRSLREALFSMAWLEEQAKLNWYAYCAEGKDHPCIPTELIDEMEIGPRPSQLPHFQNAGEENQDGLWNYFVKRVMRDQG